MRRSARARGSSSTSCSASCVARGDPPRAADGARGAMDDAMAVATADARRACVAAVAAVVVVVVVVPGTGGAVFPDGVGLADGGCWTCCTAKVSVRCWPSRTDAATARVHATENGLLAWSAARGMERTTRSTSTGSTAWYALAMALPSAAGVTGLCGRGGTDEGRLRKGEDGR
jgi:hypothetical protein